MMKRFVLVAAALSLAADAFAQSPEPHSLNRPTVVFSAAVAADWITTYRTLSTFDDCHTHFCAGASRERNPILRSLESPTRVVAAGVAMDVVGVLIARKFGKRHHKLVSALLYGASAYRGFLAVRNETTLQHSQTRAAALNAIYGAPR